MIPVLNFEDFRSGDRAGFMTAFGAACRDTGFLVLDGHGLGTDLIDQTFGISRAFFAAAESEKQALSIEHSRHNRGYVGFGVERLDETKPQQDSKEAFNIGLDLSASDPRVMAGEPFRGTNLWPELPGFRDQMLAYFNAVWRLGLDLHRAVAVDLGLDEDWFESRFDAPMATLRLLHYPAPVAAVSPDDIGAGAHTDYGSLTLLATDGVAGLQVKPRGGDWMDVPHVEGAFVVNIGDCLMRWTNDLYVSTPHRVRVPMRERYSIAFFLDPNPDADISVLPGMPGPAKYPPVQASDYLMQRLTATYDINNPDS